MRSDDAEIDPRDRLTVWQYHLDGDTVNGSYVPRSVQKRILAEPPPEKIAKDPRFIDDCRYVWIADHKDGLVFVKIPRMISSRSWRNMARNLNKARPTLNYASDILCERVPEHDVVFRMVNARGICVWHCDTEGNVVEIATRPYFTGPSTEKLPVPDPVPARSASSSSSAISPGSRR
ncbi:MAG: hypothetical protein ING19_08920 [Azospirillum sp.]|nr:hypothetical protein [Azospirillum sp.]